MPDEDSSQQPLPPEPTSMEPAPTPAPTSDAPVADTSVVEPPIETPVETEQPTEAPVNDPITGSPVQTDEPAPAVPVESAPIEPAPVNDSPAPVAVQASDAAAPVSNISSPLPIVTAPVTDHSSSAYLKSLVPLSKAERNRRRQAHIERLIKHTAEKGHVTRRDAQLLLEVSGATADRYLRELASEGRIVKENDGRYTKYRFVN